MKESERRGTRWKASGLENYTGVHEIAVWNLVTLPISIPDSGALRGYQSDGAVCPAPSAAPTAAVLNVSTSTASDETKLGALTGRSPKYNLAPLASRTQRPETRTHR